MTRVTIVAEDPASPNTKFRASARDHESVGATVGAAIDGLAAQLDESAGTLIIVQNLRPDAFFTAEQQQRLEELFAKWRDARDRDEPLSPPDQAELEALVKAELEGASNRANAMVQELRR